MKLVLFKNKKVLTAVVTLFMFFIFFGSILVGCGSSETIPKGFRLGSPHPILHYYIASYDGKKHAHAEPSSTPYETKKSLGFFVNDQFRNNPNVIYKDHYEMPFLYKNELYYIKAEESFPKATFYAGSDYTIIKVGTGDIIGNFAEINEIQEQFEGRPKCIYDAIFLDGNYLYYYFKKCFYNIQTVPDGQHTCYTEGLACYVKYEFYRFDMKTGENEEISLKLLYEKIKPYAYLLNSPGYRSNSELILNSRYKG